MAALPYAFHPKAPAHWRPFTKGHSGNPGGRARGTRVALTSKFIKALGKDFDAHGEKVITTLREKHPETYIKVIASLVPKEAHVRVTDSSPLSLTAEGAAEKFMEELDAHLKARGFTGLALQREHSRLSSLLIEGESSVLEDAAEIEDAKTHD